MHMKTDLATQLDIYRTAGNFRMVQNFTVFADGVATADTVLCPCLLATTVTPSIGSTIHS